MRHARKRQLLLLVALTAMVVMMAGCMALECPSPGTIVDEHDTIEVEGRKVPIRDTRTETTIGPDGAIVVKRDERRYAEGQRLLDKCLDAKRGDE